MVGAGRYSYATIGFYCSQCGATASTLKAAKGRWYCLFCYPGDAQQSVQRTGEARRKIRHSSKYVGGKHARR